MAKAKHEQIDYRGLELLVDEVTIPVPGTPGAVVSLTQVLQLVQSNAARIQALEDAAGDDIPEDA